MLIRFEGLTFGGMDSPLVWQFNPESIDSFAYISEDDPFKKIGIHVQMLDVGGVQLFFESNESRLVAFNLLWDKIKDYKPDANDIKFYKKQNGVE